MSDRWGYRPAQIAALTGLSRSVIDRQAVARGIRRKKIGGAVLLEARDCERVFGFAAPAFAPVSDTTLADAQRFVG